MSVPVGLLAASGMLLSAALAADGLRVARRHAVTARLEPEADVGAPMVRLPTTAGTRTPPRWLEQMLLRAGWAGRGTVWWPRWVLGAMGLATIASLVAGVPLALAVSLLAVVVPLVVLRGRRGRDRRDLEAALPRLVDDVARGLRGGLSLPVAVTAAAAHDHGPWNDDLRRVALGLARGATLGDELRRWGSGNRCDGFGLLVAALSLSAEAGGAPARALDGVAATLRARVAARQEVVALASQARASALVMAVTPVAFAALAAVTDRRTADFLLHDPAGIACLVGGCLFDLAALTWMMRITDGGTAAS